MTYRQFRKWCNDRCFDGYWEHVEACICIQTLNEIVSNAPWYKRNKLWKEEYEEYIVNKIVNPINSMIRAYEESWKIIKGGK